MIKVITGGTGLIGSAFEDGIKLNSNRDLRDAHNAKYVLSLYKPKVVIHCAAKVGGVGANMQYPADFFMDNIKMNTNIIEACHELKIPKVVSFLSTCVLDRKSTRLNSSHVSESRMPSSA